MCMHTVEYYTTVKRSKLLLPAVIWMNLTDITLSGRSHAQKSSYRKFHLYKMRKQENQSREPKPSAVKAQSHNHWTAREVL